jgi:hypothetical protein
MVIAKWQMLERKLAGIVRLHVTVSTGRLADETEGRGKRQPGRICDGDADLPAIQLPEGKSERYKAQ